MTETVENVAAAELRQFIERIERLEEEKAAIADDVKDVMGEAKSRGFDTKAIRTIIKLRRKDAAERTEEEQILHTYMVALGMAPAFEPERPSYDRESVEVARAARRRQHSTDAMDDHKALVDEMADLGLITETAREENKALADAVATKFGNGPAKALQSPRNAADAVSERAATHQPETANETMGGTGDDCSFGNRGVWPPQDGASSSRGNDSLRVVTAGETAINCEHCDGTGDVHGIDGEWRGICHCEAGDRLRRRAGEVA